MAVPWIREPGRHHLHLDRVADRVCPGPSLLIGDQRHRRDFSGAMTTLAMVLQDGQYVAIERGLGGLFYGLGCGRLQNGDCSWEDCEHCRNYQDRKNSR